MLPVSGSPFTPFVWAGDAAGSPVPFAILGDASQARRAESTLALGPDGTLVCLAHLLTAFASLPRSQLLQVTLAPGATVKAEPGAIAFCSEGIRVDTALDGGLFRSLGRVVAGEGLFTNSLTNAASIPGFVALHPPSANAKVVPLDLAALGGSMLCQRDAFLASLGAVSISAVMTQRVSAGLFGGEGLFLQRLEGAGLAFISAAGTLVQKTLAPGESVLFEPGCLVAFQPSADYSVSFVGSLRGALFAGEGPLRCKITGGPQGSLVVLQSICEHGTGRTHGGERGGGMSQRSRTSTNLASCMLVFVVMCVVLFLFGLGLLAEEFDQAPQQPAGARQFARAQRPRGFEF